MGGRGLWITFLLVLLSSCLGNGGGPVPGHETAGLGAGELPSGWSVRRFEAMDTTYFLEHLSATGIAPVDGEAITYETPGEDVFLVHIYIFSNASLAQEDHSIYVYKLSQLFDREGLGLGEEGFLLRSRGGSKGTFIGYLSFRRGRFFVLYSLIDVPLEPPMAHAKLQDRKLRALGGWAPPPRGMEV